MAALAIWAAVQRFGAAVLAFLGRLNPYQLALLALGILLMVQHIGRIIDHRHETKLQTQLTQCTAARHADREAYTKAQAESQAQNLATVARDKAERERITNDISQSYESDLARLRADRRLRNPAPQRAPGSSGLPGVSQAPGGPDGEALPLPPDDLLRAAETELQLNALIDWVNGQSKVNPNTEAAPK